MEIKIQNPEKILMKSMEDGCGLTAYAKTLEKNNIQSKDYQKNFTGYYRVRRDTAWLEKFYDYMYRMKEEKTLSFEQVVKTLSSWNHSVKKTNKNPNGTAQTLEVSFSSKLLATLNPNYPIWDSQVVKALGIIVKKKKDTQEMLDDYVEAYNSLTEKLQGYIESDEGKRVIEVFDKQFPNYSWISNMKKIDLYLWNLGK